MSVAARLAGIAPSLLLLGVWIAGAIAFRLRRALVPADPELSRRPPSRLLGRFWVDFFAWFIAPGERLLQRAGITADEVTFTSLLLAIGAGVSFGVGLFSTGGWLYLGAGILDVLDGRVARKNGGGSRAGALIDSVVDRYAEAFVFAGLIVYYRPWHGLQLVTLAAMFGSFMVSYVRARGEALGVDAKVGAMQRPERMLYLGASAVLSPIIVALTTPRAAHPMHHLVVATLLLLAIAANATALRRLEHAVASSDRLRR